MSYDWIDGQRAEDSLEAHVARTPRQCEQLRSSDVLHDARLADELQRMAVPIYVVANDADEDRQDALEAAAIAPDANIT